jgi:hypothetical protein
MQSKRTLQRYREAYEDTGGCPASHIRDERPPRASIVVASWSLGRKLDFSFTNFLGEICRDAIAGATLVVHNVCSFDQFGTNDSCVADLLLCTIVCNIADYNEMIIAVSRLSRGELQMRYANFLGASAAPKSRHFHVICRCAKITPPAPINVPRFG